MHKNKHIIGIAVVVLAGIACLYFASNTSTSTASSVKIAFLAPLSGEVAVFGENQKKGIDLAVEEINDAGGLNGKRIEIVEEDTQCDPKRSTSAAQKVITIDKVVAIIGDTCSSSVLAIAPIANEARVPLITPTAGSDDISGISPYIFRNFVANREYAAFAADYLQNVLQKKRVAILYINNAYGENMADDFVRSWSGSIVFNQGYDAETKDFRSLLSKLAVAKPDIIYLAGYYNDGALILKQANEVGVEAPFFGSGDAYDDPQFIALAGTDAVEGFLYLTVPTASGPHSEAFRASFIKKYGEEPPIYSDYAYDAVYVSVEAMRRSRDVSGDTIASALHTVTFAGASGVVAFDEKNDLVDPKIIVKQIQAGISSILE